ncbi:hypothetical protein DCAR_0205783 [Daucus carota subsp. sativus]|uniref:Hydrophobic seed protein domain-containing protein n=1 Tax=Daucus carota subsp. sativus TaxID=79200 RepID=A0A166CTW9_DAUCS|nr:hypothetical protein DCAR_0205783 [Daucus carota subsp. sativus]
MWYNRKGLAPPPLQCYCIILFLITQINGQIPNLLPPIPNLLPPIPNLFPPIPNILPPVPNIQPPVPNLIPPIPNILPPIPNILPPVPNLIPPIPNILPPIPNLIPPIPNILPPIPNVLPPIPNLIPPIPNLPSIPGLQSPPAEAETCPKDTTKMKVECLDVLGVPVLPVGALLNPLRSPCCKLIEGLVNIEAAVCFCRALSFNNTNPKVNVPVSVVLLLNYCQKDRPPGFVCASS